MLLRKPLELLWLDFYRRDSLSDTKAPKWFINMKSG